MRKKDSCKQYEKSDGGGGSVHHDGYLSTDTLCFVFFHLKDKIKRLKTNFTSLRFADFYFRYGSHHTFWFISLFASYFLVCFAFCFLF
jgi:hypothetical protein